MIKRMMCVVLGMVLGFSVLAMIPLQADAVDMHVSDACVELIKQLESFTAVPKWDYSQWTVGFGTTCPAEHLDRYLEEGIPIEEAEALLAEKLVYFDEKVNNFIEKNNLTLTQGQYDAIFSLTYNCGASWLSKSEGTLYQAIVNGATGNEFIAALSAWCTAGGNFLYGLMMRRLIEAEMYLYGRYDDALQDYYCYVKFDANGGSRSAAGQGYDTRYAARVMATATYDGYAFQGWYTDPVAGTKVTALTESHHGMTLYAHWEEDSSAVEPIETVRVTVTADVLNIRSGAGTGHTVVAQAKAGDQLDITAVLSVSGSLWGKCDRGWVCLEYTNYADVAGDQNVGGTGKVYATITSSAVNVRSGPGASYSRVTTLHRGDVVEVLEQTNVDGKIWGRYTEGWFRITGYATLGTVAGGETDKPTEPSDPNEGETKPSEPGQTTPSLPKDEVELPKAPLKATILGTAPVTLRNGPHKTYPSRGEYAVGTRVEFVEFTYFMGEIWGRTDRGWLHVNSCVMLDDENTLVNTFFVTVKTSSLYVRTGPGSSYAYVRTVKSGTELEIYALEEVNGNTWGRIYCGWISLKYTNYDPSMVPDQTPKHDCDTAGHSYVDCVVTPSCTEKGYTTHTCSKCGHSYTDGETVALGHDYTHNVVAPTCTAAGYTTHSCTRCSVSYTDGETAALGHSYTSVVTPPTTKEQGYTTHTCGNCGHSYKDSYTDPVKNTITVTVTKTYAKITASAVNVRKGPGAGYGRVNTLHRGDKVEILEQKTVSGKIWGRYEDGWFRITGYATLETVTETYEVEVDEPVVPECDHSYTHTVKAPTCTEGGYTTHTCSKCGDSYKDTNTAALGHSYNSVVTAPTASAQGYTTHTCKTCGHSYKDSYTDPVKDTVTETVTKTYATITASAVNVRKGAGASYGKVTTLHRGDQVEILEQTTVDGKIWGRCEKGWFRISGYASLKTETVEVEVPKEETPETPVEPEQPEVPETPAVPEIPEIETVTKVYATVTSGAVNVRKGAGASYGWVTTLHRGDVVEILEQKNIDGKIWGRCEKGWFRITGYAKLETVEETNTTLTVNVSKLNVRKGPGTGYDIVDSLTYGTVVKVFEIKNENGTNWARVEQGWVSMEYLK